MKTGEHPLHLCPPSHCHYATNRRNSSWIFQKDDETEEICRTMLVHQTSWIAWALLKDWRASLLLGRARALSSPVPPCPFFRIQTPCETNQELRRHGRTKLIKNWDRETTVNCNGANCRVQNKRTHTICWTWAPGSQLAQAEEREAMRGRKGGRERKKRGGSSQWCKQRAEWCLQKAEATLDSNKPCTVYINPSAAKCGIYHHQLLPGQRPNFAREKAPLASPPTAETPNESHTQQQPSYCLVCACAYLQKGIDHDTSQKKRICKRQSLLPCFYPCCEQ